MKRLTFGTLRRIPIHSFDRFRAPQGPERHRQLVGGLWDSVGRLQFDFLVRNGLLPHHYFLDIACGSLRGGVHFIPYLEAGHYLGIDNQPDLIRAGVEQELDARIYQVKRPQLVASDAFEFEKFTARPDFALAQSLFTHLPLRLIDECFRKLRSVMQEDGVFYATFFETRRPRSNPPEAGPGFFAYTRRQMLDFGTRNGWDAEYIGDWNHPRDQVMVRYRPAALDPGIRPVSSGGHA